MPLSKREILKQKFVKKKKLKRTSKAQNIKCLLKTNTAPSTLFFNSPNSLLQSLLSPIDVLSFFNKHWEAEPLIIRRATSSQHSLDYGSLFSLSDLRRLVNVGVVEYGHNINVCRYVQGKRESLNGSGKVSEKEFDKLWEQDKATFQFHQPQQFKDILWRLLSLLETYFGCLVGSNVYITPSGSQGLAPHYDDVEVFILQLEGKKHWKLYPPTVPLPETCSVDLNDKDIGEPSHDLILEAGDLMYFPRGTIHHADTPPDVPHSTHVTISTYQNHSQGNFLRQSIPLVLEKLIEANTSMRKGMPLNYLSLPGGHGNPGQQTTPRQPIHSVLTETTPILINYLHDSMKHMKEQFSMDFIASRLPPYHEKKSQIEQIGDTPTVNDSVVLCWPDHTYLHPSSSWVYVYHSILNSRQSHMVMMSSSTTLKPKGLKFPNQYLESLELIFRSSPAPAGIAVSSLPLPVDDQTTLVMTLWAEGLLSVLG